MSLFIGNLAFEDPALIDAVKVGVLSGSLVAALAGYFLIKSALPRTSQGNEKHWIAKTIHDGAAQVDTERDTGEPDAGAKAT
jgi:hypothetical protein